MNKNTISLENKNLNNQLDKNKQLDNIILENKIIEQSLNKQVERNIIDNANAYYSERYGWTLKKNNSLKQ